MKLSKKIVSMILVAAMLIAQVSVLPFATESYSSGKGDSASFALKVPEAAESVEFGTAIGGVGSWVDSSNTMGRNDSDTGYASNNKGKIFIAADGAERFFVLNPASNGAYVTFKNAPANTYTGETPAVYNGIPAAIDSSKLNGMAFRIKGMGTIVDKMVIDLQLTNKKGTDVAYTAKADMLFIDAVTGSVTPVGYTDNGIELAGNLNGWLYVAFTGFKDASDATLDKGISEFAAVKNSYSTTATGYKGIKVTFKTDDFNGKKLYFGNAMFVESIDSFRKVHGTPDAPALKEATENSITVETVAGVEYSKDGKTWSTNGKFTGLESGKKYVIYARYAGKALASSAALYTKGLADIEVLNTTYDSITVVAVPGLEYCLNEDWENKNTTGIFTGLKDVTEYTVYVREIGKTAVKSAKVKTGALPWTTGNNETAYYALNVADGITELTGALGSFTGSITSLPVVSKDGVNYIALSGSASEGAATINAIGLTYNKTGYGLPEDMVRYADFMGIAFRMNVAGGKAGTESVFDMLIHDGYTIENGNYVFVTAADGTLSSIAYENGFKVSGELDGWLVIPFSNIKSTAGDALTGVYNQSMYQNIKVTLYGSDKASDWTGRTLNIGTGLFYEDEVEFLRAYSRPYGHEVAERTKTSISVKPAEAVEYALDGTENWTAAGIFENLKPNTVYTIKARYIGRTAYSTFTVKTRLADPALVAPTKDGVTVTATTITVHNPLEDHEYSVDGVNWTESGEFVGLISGALYDLVVRIYGTTETTAPLTLQTENGIYSTGLKDAASFIYRVPTLADALSDSAGVYISADQNNGTAFGIANKLYIEDVSGEKMIKLPGSASNGVVASLSSNVTYEGKKLFDGNTGLPEEFVNNGIKAIAFRIAIKGGTAEDYSFLDFSFALADQTYSTSAKGQMIFLDAKTGVATDITYRNGIKVFGEVDGWVIVSADSFNETFEKTMLSKYNGFRVNLKSGWENKTLYVGDTLAVSDITKFLQLRSAPNAPTLLEKTTNSIKVVAVPGIEYCIDGDWANKNTTGVFTGLTENKEYKIYAKYTTNEIASQPLTLKTDMSNPSLGLPKMLSLTDSQIVIDIVPGITYTIDGGKTWNELADFGILDPNTEYTLYGVCKKTGSATEKLTFKTPKAENLWYRGDGSSDYMTVSDMEGEYYKGMYGFTNTLALNNEPGRGSGYVPLVTMDGEKFIEFKIQTVPTAQANLQLCATLEYVDDGVETRGFPRGIWMKDQWGFAIRVKITDAGTTQQMSPYYQYYDEIGQEKQPGYAGDYYLIDKTTGTWTKKTLSGNLTFKGGFDGWIIYPLANLRSRNTGLTWELIQNEWMSFQFFLRAGAGYGDSNWMDSPLYIGDTVIIEDVNLFMENHAPNTPEKVIADAHNKVTDPNFPGVMSNDCTGNKLYEGLDKIENINAAVTEITKPNEKSEALGLTVNGYGTISVTNDALNYRGEIPTELQWAVSDSLGVTFYMNVPKSLTGKVGFNVKTLEDNTENFSYNNSYYYTVSNGIAMKSYGEIELSPGFNGYVILPFEVFNYDATLSEYVDGILYTPNTIKNFTLEFDKDLYPALTSGTVYIDDFYLYQDFEGLVTYTLKIQGTDEYSIFDNVLDLTKDDEPTFPREMANNCSSIERNEGIYKYDNVALTLVEATVKTDAHINVQIGNGSSSVLFENLAFPEDPDDFSAEEYENYMNSNGMSFWLSVPEKAPMTVGLDLEIYEDDSESFWYNPNTYYYTVEDGKVTQYYGYLEFKPGFEGYVVIPFDNFFFDEASSEYVDGVLNLYNLINYFGFYFETDFYAAIGGTTISIDDIAFYQGTYRFIDAVWAKQTGNSITEVDPAYYSVNVDRFFDVEVADMSSVQAAPAQSFAPIVTVSGLALLAALIVAKRKKAEEK